jgi:hypothetical protein
MYIRRLKIPEAFTKNVQYNPAINLVQEAPT